MTSLSTSQKGQSLSDRNDRGFDAKALLNLVHYRPFDTCLSYHLDGSCPDSFAYRNISMSASLYFLPFPEPSRAARLTSQISRAIAPR